MKFRKFGKALLMTAISAGVVFGITSCVQSYSVGYLYVTGTKTSSTTGDGVISGFKIDHNTGNLVAIHGLPISSNGANPGRFVLLSGSRFLYVLNQGTTADGGPCSPTMCARTPISSNSQSAAMESFLHSKLSTPRVTTHSAFSRTRRARTFSCWTMTLLTAPGAPLRLETR